MKVKDKKKKKEGRGGRGGKKEKEKEEEKYIQAWEDEDVIWKYLTDRKENTLEQSSKTLR